MIAGSASGRPAVLIGHSGAGPLLATAGSIIDQVRGYIFVDAGLPVPGQTAMETMPPDLAAQLREMADADGWLPPWPQWWGDEVLAELISDTDTRRRFAAPGHVRGSSTAGAALARCARRLPAAERGIRRPGHQSTGTWLARDRTGEPPPRAANRRRHRRRIAARTTGSASAVADPPRSGRYECSHLRHHAGCRPPRVGVRRGTRAQRSTNPVTLCDGYGAVGTGIGQIQMAAETIRSARGEARTNDLDGEVRRMMSSGGGERDARGALPRRLHRARPVDLQITRSLTP